MATLQCQSVNLCCQSVNPLLLSALSDRKPGEDVRCIPNKLQQCDSLVMYCYATANFEAQFNKEEQNGTSLARLCSVNVVSKVKVLRSET